MKETCKCLKEYCLLFLEDLFALSAYAYVKWNLLNIVPLLTHDVPFE